MADDPNSKPAAGADQKSGGQAGGVQSNISPAPTEVAGEKGGAKPNPATGKVQAEALSDGTVPTVLTTGESHRSVPKSKASLTSIYRKADITTTLFTFVGAVVAAGIIFGIYVFLTRNQSKKPAATPGKQTTLSSSDLSKLGSFFNGNSAGGSGQILTISSPTLFKGRVGIDTDLKATGALEVGGPTTLNSLTVNQTSTLGVTSINGQLTVNGPVNLQSPATLSGGGTVKGDLAVSGNGSFGGSISAGVITVKNLSVSGTLSLDGHLAIGGRQPSVSAVSGVSTGASVQGNDSAGTIILAVPPNGGTTDGASLVNLTFSSPYSAIPVVLITPIGRPSALLEPFVTASATGFNISAANFPASASTQSYAFNFWVVQY
jgi:hypothetical protein